MRELVSITSLILVLIGIRLAQPVIVPLVLAVGLAIAFQPFARWVKRRRLPRAITPFVTVLTVTLVVAAVAGVLVLALDDLATALPRDAEAVARWRDELARWLKRHHLDALAAAVDGLDGGAVVRRVATWSATTAYALLSTLALVVLLAVFIQLESDSFPARLRAALGSVHRSRASVERTLAACGDIQRYTLIKLATSLGRALITAALTAAVGLDHVLLWATLAFAFAFVPVLGPLTAAALPVAACAASRGLGDAMLLAAPLIAVAVLFDLLIEPRILGRAMGLSPLVVLMSLALWGFVLGPVGALLAVPLTMVLRLALEAHERYGWLARLLAYRPVMALRPLEPEVAPLPR